MSLEVYIGYLGISARIATSRELFALGKTEDAWILALIAAAATARKRYPHPMPDNKAFKMYIADVAYTIVSGQELGPSPLYFRFGGDSREAADTLEDIFYKKLRCNLIHEAELKEVGFSPSEREGEMLSAELVSGDDGLELMPDFWVLHLLKAVEDSPENKS